MAKEKPFSGISEEERKDIEEILVNTINEQFCQEEIDEDFYKYIVTLQGHRYETTMTTDEVKASARLTIDFLEELKNINSNGIDRSSFQQIEEEENQDSSFGGEVTQILKIWKRISTDRLESLLIELDEVRRVGGAWAMILANPCFKSAIYAVYDRIVDKFDDDDLYLQSAYFLMRAIMKMHSDELPLE